MKRYVSMKRWEYLVEDVTNMTPTVLLRKLNEEGLDGWEFIQLLCYSDSGRDTEWALLKRRVK